MKLRSTIALLVLLSPAVPAGPQWAQAAQKTPADKQSAPSPLDLSSPEGAIRSFVSAANRLDVEGANCLVGGKISADLKTWARDARNSSEKLRLAVVAITSDVTGESATAAVTVDLSNGKLTDRFEETLSLRKMGGSWKIVPPTEAELEGYFKPGEKNPYALATLAIVYTHPARMLVKQHELASHLTCTNHLKELAVGLLTFLQDNDDKFPAKADAYKAAVAPYVRNQDAFHCPSAGKAAVAYSLNAQLQGKMQGAIRKPELTVMIYEGKQGKLDFRHDGRAAVALADGKVKRVSLAESRALRWAP